MWPNVLVVPIRDPIPLPRGRQLVTLKDAADYIMKLPKTEQNLPEWQAATEALIMGHNTPVVRYRDARYAWCYSARMARGQSGCKLFSRIMVL
jgi:hypothetical protein